MGSAGVFGDEDSGKLLQLLLPRRPVLVCPIGAGMTSKEIAELRLLNFTDFSCLQSEDRERARVAVEQHMLIREIAYQLAVANEWAKLNYEHRR
jgi:hypothetical protein